MRGIAAGQLTAFTLGAIFLAWYLLSGRSRLKLNFAGFTFQREMFLDILKVGALSCLSPLQTVLTILIFTKILAGFGTVTLAAYGIGSRLEFLLVPIAFAYGVASVPMVGMAMGAGLVTRARKVAWTAGVAAGLTVGLIGLIVAIRPSLWVSLFTSDPGVTAAAYSYFAWAGPAFGFFGMGTCLYFASQGAAKMVGPVLAGTLRLVLVGLGGWWLASAGAPAWTLFALVGTAMTAFGLGDRAFGAADPLVKMAARADARRPLHKPDLLLFRPRFFRRGSWPDSVLSLPAWRSLFASAPARAQGAEPTGVWLTQAGDARVARQQMRRRHLRRHRRAARPDRSRHRPSAGRRQESQSRAENAADDRTAAVHPACARPVPNKWSGQIYNADDGGTYASTSR